MLEHDIERLSRGVEDTQYPQPHSHSSSHSWSQSLDRHLRSLSSHRLERRLTFRELEVELDPSEWPYRGPWGHPFGIHLDSNGFPCLPKGRRQYIPWRCPYPTWTLVVGGYPPEPSIKNIEAWLDWWAHQLDTPHWWVELTAVPDMEDPKKLARKFCTSFLIPTVRCEASPGQGYTVPLLPNVLPGICFFLIIHPIRTFNGSLCC